MGCPHNYVSDYALFPTHDQNLGMNAGAPRVSRSYYTYGTLRDHLVMKMPDYVSFRKSHLRKGGRNCGYDNWKLTVVILETDIP